MSEEGRGTLVSYTADDLSWAEWVGQVLESAGLSVLMQAWDVPAGANFVEWIGKQLLCARHVVALYSRNYFSSYWCTQEWTSALVRRSLIPVRVENVVPPPPLDTRNYIDVFNVDEGTAQRRLLEAVNVLPILRRARGFPGKVAEKAGSSAVQGVHSKKDSRPALPIDQWLKDLADLDRATGLIDESLKIDLQRRILSRRFGGYYGDYETQGGPDGE